MPGDWQTKRLADSASTRIKLHYGQVCHRAIILGNAGPSPTRTHSRHDVSKQRLNSGIVCALAILLGVSIWRDHSHRKRAQAVKRAADTPQETMDVATLIWALESNSELWKQDAAKVVKRMGAEAKTALPTLILA